MLTRRIEAVSPSPTLRFTELDKQLQAQGKKVFNLAGGEPDFDTPSNIKEAAIQAIQDGFTKYTPTTGIPELKAAIAASFKKTRGLIYEPNQIVVTCGAKQAIYNLLQVLVETGDEVLVPSPYWVSYPEMVRLAGATPVELRTKAEEGFQLDPRQVEKACTPKTRCLILNSPSNPTGSVMEKKRLIEIAQCALKHHLWIISDEIYSRLVYGVDHFSVASESRDIYQNTIVVDGVSKAYAMTGWRIGYLAAPLEVAEAVGRLQDHSTSNPTSISQKAALAALTGDEKDLQAMRAEFWKRRDKIVERLSNMENISFVKPEGAFYCFVDISATHLSSNEFAEKLLHEEQVALIPGAGFGWDNYVRISFATGLENINEGLDRMDRFIRRTS